MTRLFERDRQVTKQFEWSNVSNERIAKLFEQNDVSNDWVTKSFKWPDFSNEWVTKSFERADGCNKQVTKPFEPVYVCNEWVTKLFKWADGLNEQVILKAVRMADKRLVNRKPLVYVWSLFFRYFLPLIVLNFFHRRVSEFRICCFFLLFGL